MFTNNPITKKISKNSLPFVMIFLLFSTINVFSQDGPEVKEIELKKGLHLVYDLTQGESIYQYIVDFTSVDENGVVFDWKMTEPVNKSGTITITKEAWATAKMLDFYPATKTFDKDEISMIFGKQVFDKLASFKTNDTISFGCNACFRGITTTDVVKNSYEVQDHSNTLASINTLKFSSIYKNGNFEVLNNAKFPLIVYFKWRMTIELKSYSYIK